MSENISTLESEGIVWRPIRTDRFYGSERLCARSLVIIQDPADHALDPHLPIRQRRVPSVASADPSF